MSVRPLVLAIALLFVAPSVGSAMFIDQDIDKVPVQRLIKNLCERIKKQPRVARFWFNLGRAHAMAYALKSDTAVVERENAGGGPWFGYGPDPAVPFKVKASKDDNQEKAAKAHLPKAIAAYDEALRLDPTLLVARLGRAWCVEQSGNKLAAIVGYRDTIAKSWPQDKKSDSYFLEGEVPITAEAAGYLIPLLDPKNDQKEIESLKKRVTELEERPRSITPIAVALKAGLTARDVEAPGVHVRFDADGSGQKHQWTWIRPNAGWLVSDPKQTGTIDSALQMFGSVTFWMSWRSGYDALCALDDNGDGELVGNELAGLAIWRDSDSDGVSGSGEVLPVAAYGVVALSCRHETDRSHPDQIEISPVGLRFANGKTLPTFDLILRRHGGTNDQGRME